MNIESAQRTFEQSIDVSKSTVLTFDNVDGWDVYNPSVPFQYEGDTYMFGRVERRAEWARSWVGLFRQTSPDRFTLVPDSGINPLEDPFICRIGDETVLGGVHVRYTRGRIDTLYTYFFRGKNPRDLKYFTTGPDYMKDIRLADMGEGRVGVFSRPRSAEYEQATGRKADIGFTTLDSLDELDADTISRARPIDGILEADQWGGCNQAFLLTSGYIGVIGHMSYQTGECDQKILHYLNVGFVVHPDHLRAEHLQIIGTRASFPAGPCKKPELIDCVFTSGIVPRPDGKADLYTGLGDCQVGRTTIDYPFDGYGDIINP